MEQVTEDESVGIQETYKSMKKEQKKMGTIISYAKFWWRWRYETVRFHRQFLQTREYFINQHSDKHPQLTEHFDFFVYLRKCIRTVCLQLAGIHWHVWMWVLLIVFVEALYFETGNDSYIIMTINCCLLWLTIIYMIVIWQKSIKASDRICEAYEECCTTHKQARKLIAKEEAKKKKQDEEEEALLVEDGKKKKKKSKDKKKKKKEMETDYLEDESDEDEESDDEEETEAEGDSPEFHSGAVFFGVATHHQRLFPFNSPATVLRSIQFCILLLAILEPLYLFQLWHSVQTAPVAAKWFIHVSMILSPIFLCFIVVPNTLPRFVLACSVASMSRKSYIEDTIQKHEKQVRKEKRLEAREHDN